MDCRRHIVAPPRRFVFCFFFPVGAELFGCGLQVAAASFHVFICI